MFSRRRGHETTRASGLGAAVLTCAATISVAMSSACYSSVLASDVQLEATQIKKNAEMAHALHVRCLDAGPGATPAVADALCTAEMRALSDIEQNADTLLQKAGAADGGSGG